MDWLHTNEHLYYGYKTMADATGDRIRELEIMKRLIDIETVYTCTRPRLTVLDHV